MPQLSEKTVDGGDLDGRVCTAYVNQVEKVTTMLFDFNNVKLIFIRF